MKEWKKRYLQQNVGDIGPSLGEDLYNTKAFQSIN
jgi:hypothetical protein